MIDRVCMHIRKGYLLITQIKWKAAHSRRSRQLRYLIMGLYQNQMIIIGQRMLKNGYAIGDYKQRPNMIGIYQTVRPENVVQEMDLLIDWYHNQVVNISILAEFHARYESIHPFQDGNGRTGRRILFRECLKL